MAATKHFPRMNYLVKRGLRELLTRSFITPKEWSIILEFFNNRCAFCGIEHSGNNRTGLVPDHLIPAVKYGELCLGNAVPSCQDCNDKRGDRDWREYLNETNLSNKSKCMRQIDEYRRRYPYRPIKSPAQVLTVEEYSEYKRLLDTWKILWRDARFLRDKINKRRKEVGV